MKRSKREKVETTALAVIMIVAVILGFFKGSQMAQGESPVKFLMYTLITIIVYAWVAELAIVLVIALIEFIKTQKNKK